MNLTKLESVKAELHLTIELAEKADWSTPIRASELEGRFGFNEISASYIAQACNLGAPMAKALLVAIERFEMDMCKYPPLDGQHDRAKIALASILNSFPDNV